MNPLKLIVTYLRIIITIIILIPIFLIGDVYIKLTMRIIGENASIPHIYSIWKNILWITKNILGYKYTIDKKFINIAKKSNGLIVVANHNSPIDPLILCLAFAPIRVAAVVQTGLMHGIPLLSVSARAFGCEEVTADKKEMLVRIIKIGKTIQKEQGVALIFPEGQKNSATYPKILEFDSAGLRLLHKNAPQATVLPIAVEGSGDVWPSTKSLPRTGGKIKLLTSEWRITDILSVTENLTENKKSSSAKEESSNNNLSQVKNLALARHFKGEEETIAVELEIRNLLKKSIANFK